MTQLKRMLWILLLIPVLVIGFVGNERKVKAVGEENFKVRYRLNTSFSYYDDLIKRNDTNELYLSEYLYNDNIDHKIITGLCSIGPILRLYAGTQVYGQTLYMLYMGESNEEYSEDYIAKRELIFGDLWESIYSCWLNKETDLTVFYFNVETEKFELGLPENEIIDLSGLDLSIVIPGGNEIKLLVDQNWWIKPELRDKRNDLYVGNFTYLSNDETVVSVSDNGLITAVGLGETTIEVRHEEITSIIVLKVLTEEDMIEEISNEEEIIDSNGQEQIIPIIFNYGWKDNVFNKISFLFNHLYGTSHISVNKNLFTTDLNKRTIVGFHIHKNGNVILYSNALNNNGENFSYIFSLEYLYKAYFILIAWKVREVLGEVLEKIELVYS